eukprot:11307373-Prorocentrum_lima.AAC.1
MTSSLVGSEMCIRDSINNCTTATHCTTTVATLHTTSTGCDHKCGTSFRTVSYTHLTLPTICSV